MAVIEAQLARILNFFPRVDSKATALFTMNSAILTVGVLNLKPVDLTVWYVGLSAIATLMGLLGSYGYLYRCNYPERKGGENSLVYFVEIQKRTEPQFVEQFLACPADAYRKDMLGQIWRNSQILCGKYNDLSAALRWTAITLIPFVGLLLSTAFSHAAMPIVKG